MKLVLFDVDGILIKSGSIKFDYWEAVAEKHFGVKVNRKDVYGEGKTDKAILIEHLKLKGVKDPEKDPRFVPALKDIGNIVRKGIEGEKLEKVENVEALIKSLIEEGYIVGLLTGNTREKAKAKLENTGLWNYFKVKAFGDSTTKRSELVPIALKEAKEKIGTDFKKKSVFIVGDTVRDVRCAKEAGVKSLAVATGSETIEDLKKEKPDFLFKNFNNTEAIKKTINCSN